MKKIKSGIKKDFDGIQHKSKRQALCEAGVFSDAEAKKVKFRLRQAIAVFAAAAVLLSISAMLVFAVDDGAIIKSIQSIFTPEKEESTQENSPAVIEKRTSASKEFCVLVNIRSNNSDRAQDKNFYYRSVKDAVADMGENLYYPDCKTEHASIIYSVRGSGNSAYKCFQIGYYSDMLEMFWIHEGVGHFGTSSDSEKYISNGNTFYIDSFNDGRNDGFLSWGVINGNTYQLKTDTAENAKIIIDSLKAAE